MNSLEHTGHGPSPPIVEVNELPRRPGHFTLAFPTTGAAFERSYDQFVSLHSALMLAFPHQSGRTGRMPRTLPFLPDLPALRNLDTVARLVRNLTYYVDDLMRLPDPLSTHPAVREFMDPTRGRPGVVVEEEETGVDPLDSVSQLSVASSGQRSPPRSRVGGAQLAPALVVPARSQVSGASGASGGSGRYPLSPPRSPTTVTAAPLSPRLGHGGSHFGGGSDVGSYLSYRERQQQASSAVGSHVDGGAGDSSAVGSARMRDPVPPPPPSSSGRPLPPRPPVINAVDGPGAPPRRRSLVSPTASVYHQPPMSPHQVPPVPSTRPMSPPGQQQQYQQQHQQHPPRPTRTHPDSAPISPRTDVAQDHTALHRSASDPPNASIKVTLMAPRVNYASAVRMRAGTLTLETLMAAADAKLDAAYGPGGEVYGRGTERPARYAMVWRDPSSGKHVKMASEAVVAGIVRQAVGAGGDGKITVYLVY
ncbi:hypothetical protein BC828DRAFT_415712 [Blastocladiella britannica]|nr:hypothetical protein BC828DRAFT_415712 [Blastocladiella britannica]